MRIQRGLLALFAVALLSVAACSATPGAGGPAAAAVQSKVESTLGLKLTAIDIPADAKAEGVVTYLGNNTTMATDLQIVQVFILDNEGKVASAKDKLGASAAVPGVRIITHKTIIAIYGSIPGGTDNGAALETAIKSL